MFRAKLQRKETMDEECRILRKVNKKLNATEIKTTLHKYQSPIANQQRRTQILPRQHVPQN